MNSLSLMLNTKNNYFDIVSEYFPIRVFQMPYHQRKLLQDIVSFDFGIVPESFGPVKFVFASLDKKEVKIFKRKYRKVTRTICKKIFPTNVKFSDISNEYRAYIVSLLVEEEIYKRMTSNK